MNAQRSHARSHPFQSKDPSSRQRRGYCPRVSRTGDKVDIQSICPRKSRVH